MRAGVSGGQGETRVTAGWGVGGCARDANEGPDVIASRQRDARGEERDRKDHGRVGK